MSDKQKILFLSLSGVLLFIGIVTGFYFMNKTPETPLAAAETKEGAYSYGDEVASEQVAESAPEVVQFDLNEYMTKALSPYTQKLGDSAESILLEPLSVENGGKEGSWIGVFALRNGETVPFRIENVPSTGFSAVGLKCEPSMPCNVGIDVDPSQISYKEIREVVFKLVARTNQMKQ